MSVLNGIKLKDDDTVHQIDYEKGIANKPFDSKEILYEYHGNYENYDYQSMTGEALVVYFIKVSDDVPNYNDFLNGKIVVVQDGAEREANIKEGEEMIIQDSFGYCLGDVLFVITEDSFDVEGMTLTKGLWFSHMVEGEEYQYIKSLSFENIRQLDMKFVDAYSKKEIDTMLGTYVDEVDALLGGSE